MAKPMNAFAAVLLAFPFYLAIKGRLVYYFDLARPSHAATSDTGSTSSPAPASASSNTTSAPQASNTSTGNAAASSDAVASAASSMATMADLIAAFGEGGAFG